MGEVATVMRETADVIDAHAAAVEGDGVVDADEAARMEREIDEAIRALFVLRRRMGRGVRVRVGVKKPGRFEPQRTQRGTEGKRGVAG